MRYFKTLWCARKDRKKSIWTQNEQLHFQEFLNSFSPSHLSTIKSWLSACLIRAARVQTIWIFLGALINVWADSYWWSVTTALWTLWRKRNNPPRLQYRASFEIPELEENLSIVNWTDATVNLMIGPDDGWNAWGEKAISACI